MSDKEKLDAIIAEIKEWKEGWTYRLNNTNPANPDFFEGGVEVCEHFLSFIETMQEETDSLVNLGNCVYYVPKFKDRVSLKELYEFDNGDEVKIIIVKE